MRELPYARLIFVAGIACFIAAKAFFLLSQTAAMGIPRLGDDAYVHLWRAREIDLTGVASALRGDRSAAPRAIRDIAAYCADAQAPAMVRAACGRILSNIVVPDPHAGAGLLLNGILKLGLPLKWSYATYETVIMTAVAASFAYFLLRVAGAAAAGIALAFLAFLVLMPPQGLGQFIPSTLAIGLSLALWGLVLGSVSWRRYALAGIGFLALSKVHPVALVYSAGLPVIALLAFRHALSVKAVAIAGVAIAVALAAFLWLAEPIRMLLASALSRDLAAIFVENLQALPQRLCEFAAANWALVAAFLGGIVFCRQVLDAPLRAAGIALLVLMPATLLYRVDFFVMALPLDLFARLFIGFAVVCCAVLAKVVVEFIRDGTARRQVAAAACVLLLPVPSFVHWVDTLFQNLNGRMEVVDEAMLARTVAGLDRGATLAYGELAVSPMAAFLAGAHDLGAIPMDGLSPERLVAALDERRPAAVVVPNFQGLNSLAAADSRTFERRRHGYAASAVDGLAVSAAGATIRTLYLRVENESDRPAVIGPVSYLTDGRAERKLPDIAVPARSDRWVAVEIGRAEQARTILLGLPASTLWVRGIAVNEPARPGIHWPWDAGATVQSRRRHRRGEPASRVDFTVAALFRYWNVPGYDKALEGRHVVSDESGMVVVVPR